MWVERIEQEKIPAPSWIEEKQVFEYPALDPQIVAFLKVARAAQSLHALPLLANAGLISDFGAIIRIINECLEDALFLAEGDPKTERNVTDYVEHFASTTIENAETSTPSPVPRKKIQNAASRVISNLAQGTLGGFGEIEKETKRLHNNIWNTFCNAVHSNYAEIMQMYGPLGPRARFQLGGRPKNQLPSELEEWTNEQRIRTAITLWGIAMKFGLGDLAHEFETALSE